MNDKLRDYLKTGNQNFHSFVTNNPDANYQEPSKSQIVERMMRLGIENRVLKPDNEEELESIARISLKQDYIKYYQAP